MYPNNNLVFPVRKASPTGLARGNRMRPAQYAKSFSQQRLRDDLYKARDLFARSYQHMMMLERLVKADPMPATAGMGQANGARTIRQNAADAEREQRLIDRYEPQVVYQDPPTTTEAPAFGVTNRQIRSSSEGGDVPAGKVPGRGGRERRPEDPDVRAYLEWVMSGKKGPAPQVASEGRESIPHHRLAEIPEEFRPTEAGGGYDSPAFRQFVQQQQARNANKSLNALEKFQRSYRKFMKKAKRIS